MGPTDVLYERRARDLFREYLLLFNLNIDDDRMEKRMKAIDQDLFRINYAIKERTDEQEESVDEETGKEILLVPVVLIRLDRPAVTLEAGMMVHYEVRDREEVSAQEENGFIVGSEAILSHEENRRFWKESGLEDLFSP